MGGEAGEPGTEETQFVGVDVGDAGVEQRARDLQTYLQRLVRLPTVGRCELVMTFLASGDTGARRPVQ